VTDLKGYFDYNATTPMSDSVMEQVQKAFKLYANPSSASRQGQECKDRMDLARKNVADLIGATTEEVIFTSGGSESNNLAIKGELFKHAQTPGHVIVSAIEHTSILSVIDYLKEEFGFSVTKVAPNFKGIIETNKVLEAITADTQLISIMMANNELGSIQPIKEIGDIAHEKNIYFHVDGVQAAGKMLVDVSRMKLNSLSLSAHKFYGPKGIGALYIRNLNFSQPLIHGGGQEKDIRGGTENVMGIIGLGQAAVDAKASLGKWQAHFIKLRRAFIKQLFEVIPDAKINGPEEENDCILNTVNVYLPNIRAEALSALLEHKHGFVVSLGSACSNNKKLNLSHVLAAIGLSEERIMGSFRISFGQYTRIDEVSKLVNAIYQSYKMLLDVKPKAREIATSEKNHYETKGEKTLLDYLEKYAKRQGKSNAYVFLPQGNEREVSLTYFELQKRAKQYARYLVKNSCQDKPVILYFQSGLDFIVAFYACLYAGAIAVPVSLARNKENFFHLTRILGDSRAKTLLSTEDLIHTARSGIGEFVDISSVQFFTEPVGDDLLEESLPQIGPDQVAFLQYTSGSTGEPKGVVISHENIISNHRVILEVCKHQEGIKVGGWLPHYHDMGLIGHIIHPILLGGSYTFMSPLMFIQKPVRWLQLMSRHKIESAAAPNFAYDLCIGKISDDDLADLDLSHWRVAINGSEPVKLGTLEAFSKKFSGCGFNRDVFVPAYGMAEATLMVSGSRGTDFKYMRIDEARLVERKIKETDKTNCAGVVCCGSISKQFRLKIVNPNDFKECLYRHIGEIWLQGKSVAKGYSNNANGTKNTFYGYTENGEGPFLRTGDLGFIYQDELYITGRIKDLILIRGKNYYPQDIEQTLQQASDLVIENRVAVFSLLKEGEEQVIAVQEVKIPFGDGAVKLTERLKEAVIKAHGIGLNDVVLIEKNNLPKTSSGKIQRFACKEMFLKGAFERLNG
jgi:cysteine sulfinate desulfinase/cysteine desulfurase-like protein/acyl-CoA synthetase (AMP-forming)/AMP-acid ligase II